MDGCRDPLVWAGPPATGETPLLGHAFVEQARLTVTEVLKRFAMTVWIIVGVCVVVGLVGVWWRDRRHHGRVDQGHVRDGITQHWADAEFLSRRDHYRD